MTKRRRKNDDDMPPGVSYAEAGVTFDALEASGLFDVIDRGLSMAAEPINGVLVPGATNAGRDFFLAQHAERLMAIVYGHAAYPIREIPDPYVRERNAGALDRVREMVGRFAHYTVTLQPFALDYRPDMPEAELRAWAADLVKALGS